MKKQPQQHSRIKRGLVPVDFSDPWQQALDYAIALAKPFKAEIILLHVVETLLPPPDAVIVNSAKFAAALHEEAAKCLQESASHAASPTKASATSGT